MTILTWVAIAVLGPGSLAVFAWFLRDVRRILAEAGDAGDRDPEGESPAG